MRALTTRSRGVVTLLVAALSISFVAGAFELGSQAAASSGSASSPAASANGLTSPNGVYSIKVTDGGITLSGPGESIKVDPAKIEIDAARIELNGCGHPVARVGDTVNSSGVIASGSATVCED